MEKTQQDIQAQLAELRRSYRSQLPDRISAIEGAWRAIRAEPDTRAALQTFHRQVHSMAGSAGTFGLPALGGQARRVEQRLKVLLAAEHVRITESDQTLIGAAVAELRRLAEEDIGDDTPGAEAAMAEPDSTHLVYLFEEDPDRSLRLPDKLGHFGYQVELLSDRGELREALSRQRPMALVMDFRSPEVQAACTRWLAEYQRTHDADIPVVFIAADDKFDARLASVRAGSFAFLSHPVDVAGLVDRLDAVCAHREADPYRALIVEDELALAEHYALTLRQAGVDVRITPEPKNILALLDDFQPDVVLMDLYMPDCNGMELARLIRQDSSYVSTPIVFLSAETDPDKQFGALMTGGDDFLTKPIQDRHLISVVNSRAERARALEGAMSRDSLTGLLKHTKIKEQLELEVARSERQDTSLGFAMLDMDHFKRVNDTYGHPVGDRVIKSLSFLLRQRLRGTDLIGRYGGEEFAVILPDTEQEGAIAVLEEVRRAFAAIEFDADGKAFNVTLSAGVATCRRCQDAGLLTEQADEALYEAKHAGRNRIVARKL